MKEGNELKENCYLYMCIIIILESPYCKIRSVVKCLFDSQTFYSLPEAAFLLLL